MILLDTNVISALMAPKPPGAVVRWLNRQETAQLFLSTITIAEIGYGLWILPDGKRKSALQGRFESFVEAGFEGRVLDLDLGAARACARVMGERRRRGRPISLADGLIAAIARVHNMAVATGNVRDFEGCGVEIVDPFAPTPPAGGVPR